MPKPGKKKGQKAEPAKQEPPQPDPAQVPEEPEEDVGLGVGSSSKRKQKKEKQKQIYEAARQGTSSSSVSREQSQVPEEPPVQKPTEVQTKEVTPEVKEGATKIEEDAAKVEEVAEEMGGLSLAGGTKRKRPKRKKGDAASSAAPTVGADPAIGPAPISGVASTPVAAVTSTVPSSEAGPPRCAPGVPPSHSFPPGLHANQPRFPPVVPPSQPGFPPGLVQSQPGFPTGLAPRQENLPQASSWGRGVSAGMGRGRGAGEPQVHRGPEQTPRGAPPTQQQSVTYQQQPKQPPQTTSIPQTSQTMTKPTGQSPRDVLCRYRIPTKIPGRSVGGRRISVLTNYLEMTFKPLNISRYDVSFTPDRPKKMLSEVFKKVKDKYYPNELLAFDQMKNCYSLRPLANVPPNQRFSTTVEVTDNNGRLMKFEVSLKSTGIVELSKIKRYMTEGGTSVVHPTEEVQCIDVILRQGTLESYVKAGRQFFKRPLNPIDLGHGYEMWTGLFQSAIFTSRAFINIDVAHKGFPKHQTMIDALKDFNLQTNMPIEKQRSYEIDNFLQFLKGLKVVATLVGNTPNAGQKREFICNGLVDPPGRLKFLLTEADGKQREITVADYFAKEKRYNIKYPNLNCVWVGPKDKSIYFPMELLEVAYGQPLARQLNDTQISKMVREAATPPDRRLQKIKEVISSMKYSTNPDFKKFGLEISDKFYEVNAKILEPPSLDIGRGSTVPRNGVWQANSLLKAQPLTSWGFVAVETQQTYDFNNIINMIMSSARQMGMQAAEPAMRKFDATMTSLNNVLRSALDNGIRFMFVIVSMRGRDHYHKVKQLAEREVGMLTQCIKEATIRRMNPTTAKNILLKVNSKLMGINQALADRTLPKCLREGGVMIVGADVTHPSPDQSNIPSIAAVTASFDPKCYMYNIELSIQTPKKEMIVEFEDMVFDHLRIYKERNGNQLPKKIFVFRDGVSEGQFVQVMNSELAAVHAAYQRMAGASRKPEILFLLVQKRHHTRFFNKGDYCKYNVEPGTVVDTDIVHSTELDFYLVSHQAIKGTARPTRYHAVCNDGRIPDDEVEQLTYYLCHLYSRCTRSVSYPAPTYYAHLACLRARSLTYGQKFNNKDLEKKPERLHVLDKMLQHSRMFFV